jgi:hypothetical protein
MTSILDQYKPKTSVFVPETAKDLFALRLAQKLGDAASAAHYAILATEYSEPQLLLAYRRALRDSHQPLAKRFHQELERVHSTPDHGPTPALIAIRIERRVVAAAIFRGDHLEYVDARQLSSVRDKALISAVGFIGWMLARFPVEAATLEAIPKDHEFHRRTLHDAICNALRESTLPIWDISKAALLEASGYPPLKSREQLRAVAISIWPILQGTHARLFLQDAAILGLHAQIERLFIIN